MSGTSENERKSPSTSRKPPSEHDWLPTREAFEKMSLEKLKSIVDALQVCYQEGANVYNRRYFESHAATFECMVCHETKPLEVNGMPNWVYQEPRTDPKTGIISMRYICSHLCHARAQNPAPIQSPRRGAKV